MDEAIDLRPYVGAILTYWWVILGGAILAGVIALGLYFLSTPTYQATALVAVTEPAQRLQFDPRIEDTLETDQLLRSYPELAMSDELLAGMLPQLTQESDGRIASLAELKARLQATPGTDARLLRLTATSVDPELAAAMVNRWATTFVETTNAVFFGSTVGDGNFYADQLADTGAQLAAAEQALVEFQARNPLVIIDNELMSLSQFQADTLATQRRLAALLDNIDALRSQLDSQSGGEISLADQLTALGLQLQAYNTSLSGPGQLQLAVDSEITAGSVTEQLSQLDALSAAISQQFAATEDALGDLEVDILALQEEKQVLLMQSNQLLRDRDVVQETYVALARKVDEERIASGDTSRGARIASRAAVPEMPNQASLPLTLLIAAAVGGMLATAAVILLTWWRQSRVAAA